MVNATNWIFWMGQLALAAMLTACTAAHDEDDGPPNIDRPLPKLNFQPGKFESCPVLQAWHQSRWNQWSDMQSRYWRWASSNSDGFASYEQAGPDMPPRAPGSVTNVQVTGVDEPDLVKSSGADLFQARSQSVEWVDLRTLKVLQRLDFSGEVDLRLLLVGDRLLVLSTYEMGSRATLFGKNQGRFERLLQFTMEGRLLDARLIAGQAVLITQQEIGGTITPIDGKINGVPCEDIELPVVDDYSFSLTSLYRLSLTSQAPEIHSFVRMGRADQIYMTTKHLYLFANGYTWFDWDPRLPQDPTHSQGMVAKFNLDEMQNPIYQSSGVVPGYVRNQFSFGEDAMGEHLFVATTTANGGQQSNVITVLADAGGSELATVGSSAIFGRNEDIRSVRFFGDSAYVVTFEKTDPLFVFDLSSPWQPKLLSRLVVPGFSAYLHPVSSSQLLGVGYGSVGDDGFSWLSGIQLSLFNVTTDKVITEEQIEFGGRGSHVDAGNDHHAFTYDSETRTAVLPLRLLKSDPGASPDLFESELEFSGAYVLDLNKGLEPAGKLTHQEYVPAECIQFLHLSNWWSSNVKSLDIERVIQANGEYVSLSPFGVKVHSLSAPYSTRREMKYDDADEECLRLTGPSASNGVL
jgi:inhibitor of cysteine peptidase